MKGAARVRARRPSRLRTRLPTLMATLIVVLGVESTGMSAQAAGSTVASLHFSPGSLPPGTVSGCQSVYVYVTAEDSASRPVPGALILLSFSSSSTSYAWAVDNATSPPESVGLNGTTSSVEADRSGNVQITYNAACPLPASGNDKLTAQVSFTPSVKAIASYAYGPRSATHVMNVTVAIAKPSVLSPDGTFTQLITATSVGSTVAWEAFEEGAECNYDIYLGRVAGGNTFRHDFPAAPSGGCPVYYKLVPIASSGDAGTPGYSQVLSLDTKSFDDNNFTLGTGTWAVVCGPQYFGGCEEHSSSGFGTDASYAAHQGDLQANPGAYSIGLVGSTGPQGGIANVYINNVLRGQIDFYAKTVAYRQVLFAYGAAPQGDATPTLVTVRVVAVARGANGGTNMNLDAALENDCCGD